MNFLVIFPVVVAVVIMLFGLPLSTAVESQSVIRVPRTPIPVEQLRQGVQEVGVTMADLHVDHIVAAIRKGETKVQIVEKKEKSSPINLNVFHAAPQSSSPSLPAWYDSMMNYVLKSEILTHSLLLDAFDVLKKESLFLEHEYVHHCVPASHRDKAKLFSVDSYVIGSHHAKENFPVHHAIHEYFRTSVEVQKNKGWAILRRVVEVLDDDAHSKADAADHGEPSTTFLHHCVRYKTVNIHPWELMESFREETIMEPPIELIVSQDNLATTPQTTSHSQSAQAETNSAVIVPDDPVYSCSDDYWGQDPSSFGDFSYNVGYTYVCLSYSSNLPGSFNFNYNPNTQQAVQSSYAIVPGITCENCYLYAGAGFLLIAEYSSEGFAFEAKLSGSAGFNTKMVLHGATYSGSDVITLFSNGAISTFTFTDYTLQLQLKRLSLTLSGKVKTSDADFGAGMNGQVSAGIVVSNEFTSIPISGSFSYTPPFAHAMQLTEIDMTATLAAEEALTITYASSITVHSKIVFSMSVDIRDDSSTNSAAIAAGVASGNDTNAAAAINNAVHDNPVPVPLANRFDLFLTNIHVYSAKDTQNSSLYSFVAGEIMQIQIDYNHQLIASNHTVVLFYTLCTVSVSASNTSSSMDEREYREYCMSVGKSSFVTAEHVNHTTWHMTIPYDQRLYDVATKILRVWEMRVHSSLSVQTTLASDTSFHIILPPQTIATTLPAVHTGHNHTDKLLWNVKGLWWYDVLLGTHGHGRAVDCPAIEIVYEYSTLSDENSSPLHAMQHQLVLTKSILTIAALGEVILLSNASVWNMTAWQQMLFLQSNNQQQQPSLTGIEGSLVIQCTTQRYLRLAYPIQPLLPVATGATVATVATTAAAATFLTNNTTNAITTATATSAAAIGAPLMTTQTTTSATTRRGDEEEEALLSQVTTKMKTTKTPTRRRSSSSTTSSTTDSTTDSTNSESTTTTTAVSNTNCDDLSSSSDYPTVITTQSEVAGSLVDVSLFSFPLSNWLTAFPITISPIPWGSDRQCLPTLITGNTNTITTAPTRLPTATPTIRLTTMPTTKTSKTTSPTTRTTQLPTKLPTATPTTIPTRIPITTTGMVQFHFDVNFTHVATSNYTTSSTTSLTTSLTTGVRERIVDSLFTLLALHTDTDTVTIQSYSTTTLPSTTTGITGMATSLPPPLTANGMLPVSYTGTLWMTLQVSTRTEEVYSYDQDWMVVVNDTVVLQHVLYVQGCLGNTSRWVDLLQHHTTTNTTRDVSVFFAQVEIPQKPQIALLDVSVYPLPTTTTSPTTVPTTVPTSSATSTSGGKKAAGMAMSTIIAVVVVVVVVVVVIVVGIGYYYFGVHTRRRYHENQIVPLA